MNKLFFMGISMISLLTTSTFHNTMIYEQGDPEEDCQINLAKEVVEDFILQFEGNDSNADFGDYFCDEDSIERWMPEIWKMRKELVTQESNIDLHEYNKRIAIKFIKISKDGKYISLKTQVRTAFNYSFSKEIDSGCLYECTFNMFENPDGKWKIDCIDGVLEECNKDYLIGIGVGEKKESELIEILKNDIIYDNKCSIEENDNIQSMASVITYNGNDASRYALKYALSSNPAYYEFKYDCTNFISQCIHEGGGLPMTYGTQFGWDSWYYTNLNDFSSVWTEANTFNIYVKQSNSSIVANVSSWGAVDYGDIVQLKNTSTNKYYHSLIISGIAYGSSGRADLLVCAHTSNRKHVSLQSYYAGTTKEYLDIQGSR